MSSRKEEYADPGTDVSDDQNQVLTDSAETPTPTKVEEVAPLVAEYSPLFDFGKDTVFGNQIAIATKFSRDHQALFDPKAAEFVRYELTTKLRTAIKEPAVANDSVEELKQAYLDYCAAKDWEAFSARQFENVLTDLMQRVHSVLKRNDITRGDKTLRGFKHVTLTINQTTTK